jgi:cytochrome c oxidase cbb3-type subunit 3/ubiquinol-cytochrome c reductase cytochrome c subunit
MNQYCVVYVMAAMASAIVALVGCDAMPGRPRPADQPTLPSHVIGFAELYGQSCAGCHGTDGRLGAARPLNDSIYLALVPPDRLRQTIAQGVPDTAMPGFAAAAGGPLTEAQVDALIHEMLQRWGHPSPSPEVPLPPYAAETTVTNGAHAGDPEQGLRVYAEACASCHGADGKGGPKGGSVVDAAYLALVSDQALRTAVIAGRTDLGMPDWRSDIPGQPLTAQQISDVVAWLAAQRGPVVGRLGASVQVRRPEPQ